MFGSPLTISGKSLSIPVYQENWQIDLETGIASTPKNTNKILKNNNKEIKYSGNWSYSDNRKQIR